MGKIKLKTDLKNYVPKGELKGLPKEVIEKMLKNQVKQGSMEDVSVFELNKRAAKPINGFKWAITKEGFYFWHDVILNKKFDIFFERYPKKKYDKKPKKQKKKKFKVKEFTVISSPPVTDDFDVLNVLDTTRKILHILNKIFTK